MISKELDDWLTGKDNHPDPPYERDTTTDRKQDDEPTEEQLAAFKKTFERIKKETEDRAAQKLAQKQAANKEPTSEAPAETPKPPTRRPNMFIMKTANQWIEEAKQRPVPRMLFSEFWYQGELCILFADTNTGKSILAVQIADSISRGVAVPGYRLEAAAQPVIYLDFELYDKQFEARYSINYAQHYQFAEGMHRLEINEDMELPDSTTLEDYLVWSLERAVEQSKAKVVVVDNITYLRNETERAKDALPLMKELKALKKRYNLSMLVLAHTPKRDMSKPLTRNDLSGSKMLINFCDTSFCIGESVHDKATRYLKQIKARNTEVVYDTNNISLCRIEKPHNFLQFTHIGNATEKEHLAERADKDKAEVIAECKRLKEEEGLSYQQIADKMNISKSSAERYVKT